MALVIANVALAPLAFADSLTPTPSTPSDNVNVAPGGDSPRGDTPKVEDGNRPVNDIGRPSRRITDYPGGPINKNPNTPDNPGDNDGGGNNNPDQGCTSNCGGGGGGGGNRNRNNQNNQEVVTMDTISPELRQQILDFLMKLIVFKMNLLRSASGLPQFEVKG